LETPLTQTANKKKSKPTAGTAFVVNEPCGLLEFLFLKLTSQSKNNVKSLLTHREVFVDEKVVTQYDYHLSKGQTVRIVRSVDRGEKQKDPLQILFEDDDLIVINKPAGLLSVAADNEKEKTAYHIMTDYIRGRNPKGRIFVVHRLDRDTSGVLLFAKNEETKLALQENWDSLVSQRGYAAIVEGQLEEKSGRIHSWLKQTTTLLMYSSKKPGDGMEAITNYNVIDETTNYSLVNIQLDTGRKNQIRVHMKELGHSVVGDSKYGARTNPLKRLGLHAYVLELRHPFTNKLMHFEAEIPKSFAALFKR
jgi:23S rRNA pseudouridine1911/1915/1917 synthase